MVNPVAKHFNEIAGNYNNYKHRGNLYYNELKKALIELVPAGQSVLDIGCGTGTLLALTFPKTGAGLDISSKMITIARRAYPKLDFFVHDIEKTPVNGKFDYILFNDVIEHLQNPALALNNLKKSMSPNTKLIISMANPMWEPLLMILEKLHLKMPEGPHKRISENELYELLTKEKLFVTKKLIYFPRFSLPFVSGLGLIYIYIIRINN